jgi:PrtD family type I secretion system ABC transporter
MQTSKRRPVVAAAMRSARGAFFGVAAVSGVTNLLMLTGPLFMLQIYDRVLASRSVPTLLVLCALVAGLYLFLGILEVIRSRVLTRIGRRLEEQLGDVAFDAVLTLPLKTTRTDAASQPLRDLDRMRQFMSGPGPVAICDLPWLPAYLAIIFVFHPLLGWLGTAGAVILVVVTVSSEAILRAPMARLAKLAGARSAFVEAGRRNAEALRSMGMAGAYAARWRRTNEDYLAEQGLVGDATGGFSATTKVFRLALQSAVLALGAWLAIRQEVSPGVMIAASILTARALAPIEQAIGQWRGFVEFRQSRNRLQDLLERLCENGARMPLPNPSRSLRVEGLAIAAPGTAAAIVQDLRFELSAGQGLGIIGPSGSGKSTLVRALVGIWAPARGTIRLDGAELDQWSPEALGPAVGYLPQGVELFDGTVAENIARFAPDASPDVIIAAARQAGVHDLVLSLPEGYDTRIGEGGAVLSAGQRQRVALARALYGSPFLIVLDEPNASLDSEGERALSEAILAAREAGAIVVVVAHRPNALACLDQVLVMAGGRQAAFGPRDEVLRKTTMRVVPESA